MAYLLDTNACIHLLNGSNENVARRFRAETPDTIVLCSVVKAELIYGARKSRRVAQNLDNLARFFEPLLSYAFDDGAAEHYGSIRAELASFGQPIGGNDLMIAAIARAHDATVVTNNRGEFGRVAGLRVEDWELA